MARRHVIFDALYCMYMLTWRSTEHKSITYKYWTHRGTSSRVHSRHPWTRRCLVRVGVGMM